MGIVTALIAAALVAAPVAPARGDSDVPMVYVVGWHRLNQISPDYPTYWEYAPAREAWGFTLPSGRWVEVRGGGSCTIGGVTHRATRGQSAYCHGSG